MSDTDLDLSKMLTKVNALLARADHANTPPEEADTARTMAEKIMVKYRIEEEQLRQARVASGTAAKPVVVVFPFNTDSSSKYRNHYYSMLLAVMYHIGVRGEYDFERVDVDGEMVWASVMTMVGFDSDIQMVQMLFTNLRLAFSEKLEPRYDPALSDSENVYRLRSAGVERDRISRILWPTANLRGPKVTKLYAEACAARGEDPIVVGRSVNAKTFRESYADAFVSETRTRLRRMKNEGRESGDIVLFGRQEAVDEAFYEQYPHLRPMAAVESRDPSVPCPKCKKAKSGYCRTHKPYFGSSKERPFSSVGWGAGTQAAREADLSRVEPHVTRRLGS